MLFAFLFLLKEIAHFCLQLLHLSIEVYLLITVAELDVFAWNEAPTLLLNLVEGGRIAVLWFVVVSLFIAYTLPVVEILSYLPNLFCGELDVFLLEWFSPLAQVDE